MRDAFGARQMVVPGGRKKDARRPNQVLASVLQSYEMLLVEPIYDLAIGGIPQFKVVLHLHDGVVVSISDRSRTPSILKAILGAVEAAGERIRIPMRAESTPL